MTSHQTEDNQNEPKLADKDWDKIIETLKLLARPGVKIKNIASQVYRSEKWVRDTRDKAFGYSPSLVVTLPPEVQAYLIQHQPRLKVELEKLRRRQTKVSRHELSAIELAREKHWEDLTRIAGQFNNMWTRFLASGSVRQGYIVDVDSAAFEVLQLETYGLARSLLTHLKAEFPEEFKSIDDWRKLLITPLPSGCFHKLGLVANRRTFEGTCDICQSWGNIKKNSNSGQ